MLLLSTNSTQGWDRWKETVTRRALYAGRPRRAPGSCLGLAGLSLHSAHLSPFPKRFSSSHLRAFLGLTEYCCIAKINETPDIRTTANDDDDSHKHLAKAPTPPISPRPRQSFPSSSCARRLMCYPVSFQVPLEPVPLSASASDRSYKPVMKRALSAMLGRAPSSDLVPFLRATLVKPCYDDRLHRQSLEDNLITRPLQNISVIL